MQMKIRTKKERKDLTAPRCGGEYCRYVGKYTNKEAETSGRAQSEHDQDELGYVGRGGWDRRGERGEPGAPARWPKVQEGQGN